MTWNQDACNWLGESTAIAPQFINATRMKGSTSSSVFLIQNSRDLNSKKFVLRVLDNREWLAEEPDLAAHEAAALQEAQKTRLCAPEVLNYSAHDIGFGAPVVLMSFLAGEVNLRPASFAQWLGELAERLALLHQHAAENFAWRFESWVQTATLASPRWTAKTRVWERAIEVWQNGAPPELEVFLHRDFHPVNVLWKRDKISGVVDWINACRGPAGVDIAHCRLNLMQMYGEEIADQFLNRYLAFNDRFEYHPFWDIDAVLNVCLPQPQFYPPWQEFGLNFMSQQKLMRRADDYLENVLRRF